MGPSAQAVLLPRCIAGLRCWPRPPDQLLHTSRAPRPCPARQPDLDLFFSSSLHLGTHTPAVTSVLPSCRCTLPPTCAVLLSLPPRPLPPLLGPLPRARL